MNGIGSKFVSDGLGRVRPDSATKRISKTKLLLSKETIRTLLPADLGQVRGARFAGDDDGLIPASQAYGYTTCTVTMVGCPIDSIICAGGGGSIRAASLRCR